MGNAACESSYGLHFLRLPELLFQSAALGHILGKQLEGGARVAIRDGAAGNPNHGANSIFSLPLGDQSVEGGGRAQLIGQLEPLMRIQVEASEMLSYKISCGGISQHGQQRGIHIQ